MKIQDLKSRVYREVTLCRGRWRAVSVKLDTPAPAPRRQSAQRDTTPHQDPLAAPCAVKELFQKPVPLLATTVRQVMPVSRGLRHPVQTDSGPPQSLSLAISAELDTLALPPLKQCVPTVATLWLGHLLALPVLLRTLAVEERGECASVGRTPTQALQRVRTAPLDTAVLQPMVT